MKPSQFFGSFFLVPPQPSVKSQRLNQAVKVHSFMPTKIKRDKSESESSHVQLFIPKASVHANTVMDNKTCQRQWFILLGPQNLSAISQKLKYSRLTPKAIERADAAIVLLQRSHAATVTLGVHGQTDGAMVLFK